MCLPKKLTYFIFFGILILFFILFTRSALQGKQTLSSRAAPNKIIGGRDVNPGEFPFVARISNGATGFLIKPHWILTAGHVISHDRNVVLEDVVLYAALNITDKKDFEANKLRVYPIRHKNYVPGPGGPNDGNIINDIGLLYFEENIAISPAPLPDKKFMDTHTDIYNKGSLAFMGWGCDGISPTPGVTMSTDLYHPNYIIHYGDKLKVITLPLIDVQHPYKFFAGYFDERSLQNITCWGDSGGPSLYTTLNGYVAMGIISAGPNGISKSPMTSVKIYEYIKWIEEQTKNPPQIPTPIPCINQSSLSQDASYPVVSSMSLIPPGIDYFIYKNCVYNTKTKQKTGHICYVNNNYRMVDSAKQNPTGNEPCYIPVLSDCLSRNEAIGDTRGKKCRTNDKIPQEITYNWTYTNSKDVIYKCKCTDQSIDPILVVVTPTRTPELIHSR